VMSSALSAHTQRVHAHALPETTHTSDCPLLHARASRARVLLGALRRPSHTALAALQVGAWDQDNSGTLEKSEFYDAVTALGFSDLARHECDALFDVLDADGSGLLERLELPRMLGASDEAIASMQAGRTHVAVLDSAAIARARGGDMSHRTCGRGANTTSTPCASSRRGGSAKVSPSLEPKPAVDAGVSAAVAAGGRRSRINL
jgi:hypothetical protein